MGKLYRVLFILKIITISLYFNLFSKVLRYKIYKPINFEDINNNLTFYNISYDNCQNFLPNINIKISFINYSYSFIFHRGKIEYKFGFYDKNNNLIIPSYLNLYYKLHIFCQTNNIFENKNIKSIANIYRNKLFNCIEYFNINEKIDFGIEIYKNDKYLELIKIYLFKDSLINYNNYFSLNNMEFDPFILINEHIKLENKIDKEINNSNIINKTFLLKQSYMSSPQLSINLILQEKRKHGILKIYIINIFVIANIQQILNVYIKKYLKYVNTSYI